MDRLELPFANGTVKLYAGAHPRDYRLAMLVAGGGGSADFQVRPDEIRALAAALAAYAETLSRQ